MVKLPRIKTKIYPIKNIYPIKILQKDKKIDLQPPCTS